MASIEQLRAQKKNRDESSLDKSEKDSAIGKIQSIFAGVGSGLIEIPKGLFSLGATLMDLGADTNKAAEVEKYFDDLTTWDEKAEATTAGKITQVLVNLGVPGAFAFTKGASLANKALKSKSLRQYFLVGDKATQKNLSKAALKAAELNTKGKTARFMRQPQRVEQQMEYSLVMWNRLELLEICLVDPLKSNGMKNMIQKENLLTGLNLERKVLYL